MLNSYGLAVALRLYGGFGDGLDARFGFCGLFGRSSFVHGFFGGGRGLGLVGGRLGRLRCGLVFGSVVLRLLVLRARSQNIVERSRGNAHVNRLNLAGLSNRGAADDVFGSRCFTRESDFFTGQRQFFVIVAANRFVLDFFGRCFVVFLVRHEASSSRADDNEKTLGMGDYPPRSATFSELIV